MIPAVNREKMHKKPCPVSLYAHKICIAVDLAKEEAHVFEYPKLVASQSEIWPF